MVLLALLTSCRQVNTEQRTSTKSVREVDSYAETKGLNESMVTATKMDSIPNGWIDLGQADSSFLLDIRYATDNNFVSKIMYPCGRCILRSEAASPLIKLQKELSKDDLGLKFFDCYRPSSVQQLLWDKVPDARYVTPPEKGSMHNRGVAVDLTLVRISTGEELPMGTEYDHFGIEAYHSYTDHSPKVHQNRTLLKSKMHSIGFKSIRTEWWHYSFTHGSFAKSNYIWDCQE